MLSIHRMLLNQLLASMHSRLDNSQKLLHE